MSFSYQSQNIPVAEKVIIVPKIQEDNIDWIPRFCEE